MFVAMSLRDSSLYRIPQKGGWHVHTLSFFTVLLSYVNQNCKLWNHLLKVICFFFIMVLKTY